MRTSSCALVYFNQSFFFWQGGTWSEYAVLFNFDTQKKKKLQILNAYEPLNVRQRREGQWV